MAFRHLVGLTCVAALVLAQFEVRRFLSIKMPGPAPFGSDGRYVIPCAIQCAVFFQPIGYFSGEGETQYFVSDTARECLLLGFFSSPEVDS